MKKNRFLTLLYVLVSIGIALAVVCWAFSDHFKDMYVANEEEKLQLYVTLITSDLSRLPEGTTDGQLEERALALFNTIEGEYELDYKIYLTDDAGALVGVADHTPISGADGSAGFTGQSEYRDGVIRCANTFARADGREGALEITVGTEPLHQTNREIWRTVFLAFAAVCVLATVVTLLLHGKVAGDKPNVPVNNEDEVSK